MELGFGTAAGITMATGIIVPIVGAVQVNHFKNTEMWCIPDVGVEDPYSKCRIPLRSAYRTRDIGGSVLGGGIGLLTGGLTWMIGTPQAENSLDDCSQGFFKPILQFVGCKKS